MNDLLKIVTGITFKTLFYGFYEDHCSFHANGHYYIPKESDSLLESVQILRLLSQIQLFSQAHLKMLTVQKHLIPHYISVLLESHFCSSFIIMHSLP